MDRQVFPTHNSFPGFSAFPSIFMFAFNYIVQSLLHVRVRGNTEHCGPLDYWVLVDWYMWVHPFVLASMYEFLYCSIEYTVTMWKCNSFSFVWKLFPSSASHFVDDDGGYDNNNRVVSITTMVILKWFLSLKFKAMKKLCKINYIHATYT